MEGTSTKKEYYISELQLLVEFSRLRARFLEVPCSDRVVMVISVGAGILRCHNTDAQSLRHGVA